MLLKLWQWKWSQTPFFTRSTHTHTRTHTHIHTHTDTHTHIHTHIHTHTKKHTHKHTQKKRAHTKEVAHIGTPQKQHQTFYRNKIEARAINFISLALIIISWWIYSPNLKKNNTNRKTIFFFFKTIYHYTVSHFFNQNTQINLAWNITHDKMVFGTSFSVAVTTW